jgi:hypothetical protein
MAPQLRRVAMLWNKDDLGMSQRYDAPNRLVEISDRAVEIHIMTPPEITTHTISLTDRPFQRLPASIK